MAWNGERPPVIWALSGPTASGKTALAHRLADGLSARILSVDAMQAYRGMDIGTAKPSPEERRRYGYVGLDYLDPSERNTAGRFVECARAAMAADPGRVWVAAGGTGLYFLALAGGLRGACEADPAMRAEATAMLERDGAEGLRAWLRARAPERWAAIADPANPRRLLRAVEQALAGEPPPPAGGPPPLRPRVVVLRPDRAALRARIAARARAMFDAGLVEEVRALRARAPAWSDTAAHAIGYAEATEVLDGRCSIEDAVARVSARTARYARRQMTWFRNRFDPLWIEAADDADPDTLARAVRAAWERHGPLDLAD
jgi:tRNA dimethylallyltransferase